MGALPHDTWRFASIFLFSFFMAKKLFVGNLSWHATVEDLTELFSPFGEIEDVFIPKNERGQSKGFGFVTFTDADAADAGVESLHGTVFMDRDLVVNEARPKPPRREGGYAPRGRDYADADQF